MEIVLKHLGYLLLIFALFPLLPLVVAFYYGEPALPFLAPVIYSLMLGIWLIRSFGKEVSLAAFDLPRSISLMALSFVTLSLIGMWPYVIIAKTGFVGALFESVSGFSTTGLTIYNNVEILPKSLLLWRAETQWIGGIGMVVLFLLIVSALRSQDSLKDTTTKARAVANLYQAQGASQKLESNLGKSIRNTILIYIGYTLLGSVLLVLVGLSVFEAVAIAFTAISTAGFSVTNQFYMSWPVLAVVSFIMLAGAISFVIHNQLFKGRFRELFGNRTLRFYFFTIAVFVILAFAFLGDIKVAFFETLSAITTTGFSIADINLMHPLVILSLVLCMIIGGMLCSTAGGIKINRLKLMFKSISWMVKKAASPSSAIIPIKVDGVVVEDEQILVTHAFIACYILVIISGTIIMMVTGVSFMHSVFQTTSALGGVGLQTMDLAAANVVVHFVLIVAMLFGRLEIFPLLVLGKFIWDSGRSGMRRRTEESRKLFYTKWIPGKLWKRKF